MEMLNKFLLVKPDPKEEVKGGIVIPDKAQDESVSGTVISGELAGKHIYYPSGISIEFKNELVILNMEDIWGYDI